MNYEFACELHLRLLNGFNICGGMVLHAYILQIRLWRGYDGTSTMIWTKWFMTKVVVKERVFIWWYKVCGLMFSCEWICYNLLNMLCLVYGDFLGTLGGSSIILCYLHIALVLLRSCLRWWFLCEVDVYEMFMTYECMCLCYKSYYERIL